MAAENTYADLLKTAVDRLPLDRGNYPYVTARVKAKKSLLLPAETYERLLQMGIPAIARFLGEGQYHDEMLSLGARYDGVDLVEMATRDNLATVFTQIIGFSEGPLRDMIGHYLDRWDVWNVKTILRGKFYGAAEEEILEDAIAAGSLGLAFLERLVALETIEEVVEELEDTPYLPAVLGLTASPDEVTTLAPYEDLLDRLYYVHLLDAIPPSSEPTTLFHNFVRLEIDVVNLKTLLRILGVEGLQPHQLFIPRGRHLRRSGLREMAQMDLLAVLQRLRDTPYHETLAPHLQEEGGDLARGIRAMEKWLLSQASTGANLHPLSILPVLDYVISKTREVENIRIIARGKESGLDVGQIREMLVV
ncbi:MAG: ATP synthase A1 subunit C [Thermoplasmata archaeon]